MVAFHSIGMIAVILLTPVMSILPENVNALTSSLISLKQAGYFNNGRFDIPVAKYCNSDLSETAIGAKLCSTATQLAQYVQVAESVLFCSDVGCTAKYDPRSGLCQCAWGTHDEMNEEQVWPGIHCEKTVTCYAPFEAHWNPAIGSCTCAIDVFPKSRHDIVSATPNPLKEEIYGWDENEVQEPTIDETIEELQEEIDQLTARYEKGVKNLAQQGLVPSLNTLAIVKKVHTQFALLKIRALLGKHKQVHKPRQVVASAVSLAPLPTFIPPPNTEVTQQLLQESLLIQPQKSAVVGSVIPHFADGVITFLVQLDGPISQTLALNATDTLVCNTLGSPQQPHLMLIPRTVKNGTAQTILPTCLVIAVNMYEPEFITYWVQKEDGSVFSLLSDNKIHAIDQLDTSQPAAIVLQMQLSNYNTKRDAGSDNLAVLKRRQIFAITCGEPCPFYHMKAITGSNGYCGCMFKDANQPIDILARAVENPSPYTATMTAEACSAMTCINNGGKPALFNPFTATCWCTSPTYVEEHQNAYNGM